MFNLQWDLLSPDERTVVRLLLRGHVIDHPDAAMARDDLAGVIRNAQGCIRVVPAPMLDNIRRAGVELHTYERTLLGTSETVLGNPDWIHRQLQRMRQSIADDERPEGAIPSPSVMVPD